MNVPVNCDYSREGQKSTILRGIKMVLGVSWFIITQGIKYRHERIKRRLYEIKKGR